MQNSEYSKRNDYNPAMRIYVGGSAAPKPERVEEVPDIRRRREQNARAKKAAAARAKELRAEAQKKRIRAAAFTAACAVVLCVCILTLSAIIKGNNLSSEISALEAELDELVVENDSIEYEINSSVDLAAIIETATEELGMVRSSADQIITYEDSDQEYVQQVAEIPE